MKKKKLWLEFLWIILLGLLAVVVMTGAFSWLIYLSTKGDTTDMRSVLSTMFASLCGGALTLFGVWLTMRKADNDRLEDASRLREKMKPYLDVTSRRNRNATDLLKEQEVYISEDDKTIEDLCSFNFYIRNIVDPLFCYKKVVIDGVDTYGSKEIILAKNETMYIRILYVWEKWNKRKPEKITIYGTDALGNMYKYEIEYERDSAYNEIKGISSPIFVEEK